MNKTTKILVTNAVIAALYVVLTVPLGEGIAFGPIQFRPAEALTLLPFLFPQSILGLFAGCMLSNILSPLGPVDVIFGSLATLAAAFLTSRCKRLWLAVLPPVLINAVVVGALIVIGTPDLGWISWPLNAVSVGASEAFTVVALGVPMILAIKKLRLAEKMKLYQ